MLNKLGQLVFYDRYAKKCLDREKVKEGDLVVICPDPQKVAKQLAHVTKVDNDTLHVTTDDGSTLTLPLYTIDLPLEDFNGAVSRMVSGLRSDDVWLGEPCREAIQNLRFVPAGRAWAGLGVDADLTLFNCFVLPNPEDSRKGILATLGYLVEIMSRGGGVGFNLASLRPEFFPVRGVNGRSSGAVVWGELFSFATNVVHQGGSRRGSLMLMLMDWHPDILTFVDAKRDMKRLTGANCSVGISDEFMHALRTDSMWDLVFPDIEADPVRYDAEWDGDLKKWKARGYPVKVVKSLPAKELWRRIAEAAHASAEPGLHFIERSNTMANSYYYPEGTCYSTNPCGEQILPPWGICNLGHINLAAHLIGDGLNEVAKIDWDRLGESVRIGVRFLDRLITVGSTTFPEQQELKAKERRIGLGTMGLAEMLMRLRVSYGDNPECDAVVDAVYAFICTKAYEASVELAKEEGPFPLCDKEKLVQSKFIQQLPLELQQQIREHGLRNVSIITQAPTGSCGTLVGTSTGIEPYPWLEWERKGRLGVYTEYATPVQDFLAACPDCHEAYPLWFVSAESLSPRDHVAVQSRIQKYTDSSISKTSNLPSYYTVEDVMEFYKLLYDSGCKGGTVYRDGSRSEQVLSKVQKEPEKVDPLLQEEGMARLLEDPFGLRSVSHVPSQKEPEKYDVLPVPRGAYPMDAISLQTPVGKLNVKVGKDSVTKEPFEVWLDVSRSGTTMAADREALARLISLILRLDSPISPTRRVQLIIDQLSGIQGGEPVGFGVNKVLSLPDAIAQALLKLVPTSRASEHPLDICPECHQPTLLRVEGCEKCASCGYARC